ncbi:Aminotransferase [Mycena kentingensis (nom. inval.)]|nr:Aminotransferase [Mycena kentingensis (nom. inval.)]
MGRTKSSPSKTPKATYAERVLCSFSQIQREHRRHSIHIASIRAQVQKTATARKDKLGPHWKNYVAKAVHKLQDDGFFEPSEPAGSVALTPQGKKAIQSARRALDIATDDSADEEARLWKEVVHPGSVTPAQPPAHASATPTSRRRTRKSFAGRDDNDDELVELPGPTRKRARTSFAPTTSISTAPRTYNKYTKAQLMEEITTLRRLRESDRLVGLRADSPLTELGDDDDMPTGNNGFDLPPSPIETPSFPSAISNMNPVQRASAAAVVRTQSGSLINLVSKRPTPAPTEADPNEDVFAGDTMQIEREPTEIVQQQRDGMEQDQTVTVTPDATPFPNRVRPRAPPPLEIDTLRRERDAIQIMLAARTNEVASVRADLEGVSAERDVLEAALKDKEGQLASRLEELAGVRGQRDALVARTDDLETELSEGRRERDELSGLNVELVGVRSERDTLAAALEDKDAQLASRLEELAGVQSERDVLVGRAEDLEHNLAGLRRERDELAAEVQHINAQVVARTTELAGVANERDALSTKKATLEQLVESLEADKLALVGERDAAAAACAQAELVNAEVSNQLEGAQNELVGVRNAMQAEMATLEGRVGLLEAEKLALAGERDGAASGRAEAEAALAALQIVQAETTARLEETLNTVQTTLKPQLAALDAELLKRIESERDVRGRLEVSEQARAEADGRVVLLQTRLENARDERAEVGRTLDAVRSQLVQKEEEVKEAERKRGEERDARGDAERELAVAQARIDEMHGSFGTFDKAYGQMKSVFAVARGA